MKQKLKLIFFYFLLPVFLTVIGSISLVLYLNNSEFGLLNLDVRGSTNQLVSTREGEQLKGDIVQGRFHSQYPKLGIISVRFYNQDRDSDDTLVFRIKEEGQDGWYYEAKYKTDQFMPHKLFPFGFPIIENSSGINYEFQIESLRGATGSGILIDRNPPVFLAKSSFTRSELVSNRQQLLYFLGNKFINIFGDPEIFLNNLLFFLPLIYYVIFVLSNGVSFQFLTGLALSIVIYDIFWLRESYDSLFIGILFFWSLISHRFRFESRIAAILALGFLIFTPIMLILGQDALAEKTAVWAYLFLCITVFQQIYEMKKHPKNLFNIKILKLNLFKFNIDRSNKLFLLNYCIFKSVVLLATANILFRSAQKVFESFKIYEIYFPLDHYLMFIKGIILPNVVLLFGLLFIIIKLKKNLDTKIILGLIFALIYSSSSVIMINKATLFKNYPTIFYVSANGSSEAWVDINISGSNFGDKPFVGMVYINGKDQRIIDWTDKKIIFRTNPTTTKSGNIMVATKGKGNSNKYIYKYNYK